MHLAAGRYCSRFGIRRPVAELFAYAAALALNGFCIAGWSRSDVVSAQAVKPGSERSEVKTITVAEKLKELRTRCRKGKLVDAKGREIRFYQLVGCWGNPPEDYQEILERQAKELASLRKRYHVIEMTCNPSGQHISRSIARIKFLMVRSGPDTHLRG